jgi:type VI secretion system protein
MRETRLLERIGARKREPHARGQEDPRQIIDSVLEHLQRILNTRQGNVPIAESFGLPDLTDIQQYYPDSLRGFENAIRQTIQNYEPRLKAIRVRFIPNDEDPLSLSFQIVGRLANVDYKETLQFESTMGSDGKISIRK